jgi:hypothetical protein
MLSEIGYVLKSYVYGLGWLLIIVYFLPIAVRAVLGVVGFSPMDARKEIEKQNLAFAVAAGLFLLGLVFGVLYFAAHVS